MFRGKLFDAWSLPDLTNTYGAYDLKDIIARFNAAVKPLSTRKLGLVFCGIFTIGLFFSLRAYPLQFLLVALRLPDPFEEPHSHVCSINGRYVLN